MKSLQLIKRWTIEDLAELKSTPGEPNSKEPGEIKVKSATVMDEDLEKAMKITMEATDEA